MNRWGGRWVFLKERDHQSLRKNVSGICLGIWSGSISTKSQRSLLGRACHEVLPPFLSWNGGEEEGKENFRGLPCWACTKAPSNSQSCWKLDFEGFDAPHSCCSRPGISPCPGLPWRMMWSFLATHSLCHFLSSDVFHIAPAVKGTHVHPWSRLQTGFWGIYFMVQPKVTGSGC